MTAQADAGAASVRPAPRATAAKAADNISRCSWHRAIAPPGPATPPPAFHAARDARTRDRTGKARTAPRPLVILRPTASLRRCRARMPRISREDLRGDALRNPHRRLPDPVPVEMRIALRRLQLRMPEQAPDHRQVLPERQRTRGDARPPRTTPWRSTSPLAQRSHRRHA